MTRDEQGPEFLGQSRTTLSSRIDVQSRPTEVTARCVLIHCNADLQIGMGHLSRSLCLAAEARNAGWEVVVAGRFGGRAIEHAAGLAPEQALTQLDPDRPLEDLRELIDRHKPSVLHFDTYDASIDSFAPSGISVSNMQDGEFGRRQADLHIDANLDAELRYTPTIANEKAILGPAGMQIRDAFRNLRYPVRENLAAPFNVLVMLGGTDPSNFTPRLVQELVRYSELRLTVICRPEIRPTIEQALGRRSRQVEYLPFTSDLPSLAASMDLVVTAAGTSVWDFAAARIPMAIVAVADNQLPGYRSCEAHGLGLMLGEAPHEDLGERVATLVSALNDPERLRRSSDTGVELVDGLGAWRVVSAWEELVESKLEKCSSRKGQMAFELVARAANVTDAQTLFDWRNDPESRAVSRSQAPLSWEDHVGWLIRTVESEDRKLLIIEEQEEPIATVRWDRRGARAWEVSITLAPARRGKGLASAVLTVGEQVLAHTEPIQLLASIHTENHSSQRLFVKAGYLPHLPADSAGFETRGKWLLPSHKS